MVGVLTDQAERDEEPIEKMGKAVRSGDKDTVFRLACRLTGN